MLVFKQLFTPKACCSIILRSYQKKSKQFSERTKACIVLSDCLSLTCRLPRIVQNTGKRFPKALFPLIKFSKIMPATVTYVRHYWTCLGQLGWQATKEKLWCPSWPRQVQSSVAVAGVIAKKCQQCKWPFIFAYIVNFKFSGVILLLRMTV